MCVDIIISRTHIGTNTKCCYNQTHISLTLVTFRKVIKVMKLLDEILDTRVSTGTNSTNYHKGCDGPIQHTNPLDRNRWLLHHLLFSVGRKKAKLYAIHGMMYVPNDVVNAPRIALTAPKKGKATAKNNMKAHNGIRATARTRKG